MVWTRWWARSSSRWMFGGAVFLAAFLLFCCEPMAARQLLPAFGGSAAVWMTCLAFFQGGVLGGYLYAHWMTRRATARRVTLHWLLLAAAAGLAVAWAGGGLRVDAGVGHPVLRIVAALSVSIGVPFVVLASTSPLLQVWFVVMEGEPVPYGLFALSNAASLLALLLYPAVIEPHVTLRAQRWMWAAGVVLFAALSAWLSARVRGVGLPTDRDETALHGAEASTRQRLLWFLLPMGAAMQLSAVTGHITTNVAAIPLLWILPLAVYLLSFIAAFEMPRLFHRGLVTRFLLVMLASLGYVLRRTGVTLPIGLGIGFFLLELGAACWFCHAETYALRPARAAEATHFYLSIAAGGLAGSFAVAIAAPMIFALNYDLALAFLATALLVLLVVWEDGWTQRLMWMTGCVLMAVFLAAMRTAYGHGTMLATRNFYGSLRVKQEAAVTGDPMRVLLNGTIQHGTEIFSAERTDKPTTYYAEDSGVGLALAHCCVGTVNGVVANGGRLKNVGVVGLGAGTLAAYGRAGDRMRFYEINPAVLPVAQHLFTYLRDSGAQLSFAEGDARASLARETPQGFDVLVIDAFSGDAIPLHLLTVEAMAIYRRHLAPGGVLAFHVSNQYVELQPEVEALAQASGMEARSVTSLANEATGEFRASWVLVAEDARYFEQEGIAGKVNHIDPRAGVRAWTDDYASLLPLVRW